MSINYASTLSTHQSNAITSRIAGYAATLAGVAILGAVPFSPRGLRPILFLATWGASFGACAAFKMGDSAQRSLNDIADTSNAALQNAYFESASGQNNPADLVTLPAAAGSSFASIDIAEFEMEPIEMEVPREKVSYAAAAMVQPQTVRIPTDPRFSPDSIQQTIPGRMAARAIASEVATAKVGSAAAVLPTVNLFDWQDFANRPKDFPHLALLAPTNGGKTTLVEWLCSLLPGKTIAILPHWQSPDFAGADLIIGKGRNYGTDARPYLEKEDAKGNITTEGMPEVDEPDANTTVCQFLNWLVREGDRRYQLTPEGKFVGGEPINVCLDELPAYANRPGVKDALKVALFEYRKVGIRIIFLSQGFQVKTLGIEGESDLRDNLTWIRLGSMAIEYADIKARNSKGSVGVQWEQNLRALESFDRPGLVGEAVANIPRIQRAESVNAKPAAVSTGDPLEDAIARVATKHGSIRPCDVGSKDRSVRGKATSAEVTEAMRRMAAAGRGTFANGKYTL